MNIKSGEMASDDIKKLIGNSKYSGALRDLQDVI